MTSADIPDALDLWAGMPGLSLFPSDSPDGLARYLIRNPGLSVVIRVEGRLIGAALAGHDARRGYLHHVAVAEDYRRRGLGRKLVDWCLAALTTQGIGRCHIFVNADNPDGKGFWKRVGWEERPSVHVMSLTTNPDNA